MDEVEISKEPFDPKKLYEVWVEGYAATGESGTARRINAGEIPTLWMADTFQEACEKALITLKWDMSYYDKEKNTYWACKFFDNELEVRKSFG